MSTLCCRINKKKWQATGTASDTPLALWSISEHFVFKLVLILMVPFNNSYILLIYHLQHLVSGITGQLVIEINYLLVVSFENVNFVKYRIVSSLQALWINKDKFNS